jgi:putative tricarboxylic transport membrane protein
VSTPDRAPTVHASPQPGLSEIVVGALCVVLGAVVLVHSAGFPTLPGGYPGPGLFPQILATLIALAGLAVAWQGLRLRRRTGRTQPEPDSVEPREQAPRATALSNAAAVLLAVPVYMALVERIGFPATMSLINAGLMLKLGVRWAYALPVSVGVGLAVFYLFARVLRVPLPFGPLG